MQIFVKFHWDLTPFRSIFRWSVGLFFCAVFRRTDRTNQLSLGLSEVGTSDCPVYRHRTVRSKGFLGCFCVLLCVCPVRSFGGERTVRSSLFGAVFACSLLRLLWGLFFLVSLVFGVLVFASNLFCVNHCMPILFTYFSKWGTLRCVEWLVCDTCKLCSLPCFVCALLFLLALMLL